MLVELDDVMSGKNSTHDYVIDPECEYREQRESVLQQMAERQQAIAGNATSLADYILLLGEISMNFHVQSIYLWNYLEI